MADQNDSSQDKTEEATPKRLEDARKKGQVGRSKEFNTMVLLMASAGVFMLLGQQIMHSLLWLMKSNFVISRDSIFDPKYPGIAFERSVLDGLSSISPIFIALALVAFFAPISIGGWSFSTEALKPKLDKLNPVSGMKRLFGMNSMMELLKAFLKFLLVCCLLIVWLWMQTDDMLRLGQGDLRPALVNAGNMLAISFIFLSISTVVISLFDVPFQIWEHKRKLKMTKQEVKDEFKETEGKPEVKQQVRNMQRELANRRMMEAIPTADVIVTNPTHYAVALKYEDGMSAPKVVAKGVDSLAERIKSVANEHKITIYPAPLLARALYHTTKLNQEIPEGLYVAVAQVLAYIFQLKASGAARRHEVIKPSDDLPIPEEFHFDP